MALRNARPDLAWSPARHLPPVSSSRSAAGLVISSDSYALYMRSVETSLEDERQVRQEVWIFCIPSWKSSADTKAFSQSFESPYKDQSSHLAVP